MTVETLFQTDSVRKGNRVLPSPETMYNWFLKPLSEIEEAGSMKLDHKLSHPVELTSSDKETGLTAYNKGMIRLSTKMDMEDVVSNDAQVLMPNHANRTGYMFGLIWSFTAIAEVIKVFRGANVFACDNGVIMGADDVQTFKFKKIGNRGTERALDVAWRRAIEDVEIELDGVVQDYSTNFQSHARQLNSYTTMLQHEEFDKEDINKIIGDIITVNYETKWINQYMLTFALDSLLDHNAPSKQGRYNIYNEGNQTTWNIYNAFTYYLNAGKTEIDSHVDKTLAVNNLLSVVFGRNTVSDFK